jgi:hypothetical protein
LSVQGITKVFHHRFKPGAMQPTVTSISGQHQQVVPADDVIKVPLTFVLTEKHLGRPARGSAFYEHRLF